MPAKKKVSKKKEIKRKLKALESHGTTKKLPADCKGCSQNRGGKCSKY